MPPVARPRTTGTSQRAAEAGATIRVEREIRTGKVGADFIERLKAQVAAGFRPNVCLADELWDTLDPNDISQFLDMCGREASALDDWRWATLGARFINAGVHLSAMCESLVRVPPSFDVAEIPYPRDQPDVRAMFKRAQIQIERNRALAQVAAFSEKVVDGDGLIRARVFSFLV